jgi:hypothetical protein
VKKFALPLATAISAAMLASFGCSSDKESQASNNTKVCVDASGNRIPDDKCSNQSSTGVSPYRWYFISQGELTIERMCILAAVSRAATIESARPGPTPAKQSHGSAMPCSG